jgi:KaiC/GvpD/RAD55 family RecA-like ATPase
VVASAVVPALITGVPGTSKTTLSGRFVEAACRRGERTLFVRSTKALIGSL